MREAANGIVPKHISITCDPFGFIW